MKIWLIVVLFLAGILVDGIIFPALFGFREGFLTIIFLVVMLLYYEVSIPSLIFGMVFAGLAELHWGLKTGVLVLPLFASAAVFFLLSKFFNIRSRFLTIILGVTMLVVFWELSILINKVI